MDEDSDVLSVSSASRSPRSSNTSSLELCTGSRVLELARPPNCLASTGHSKEVATRICKLAERLNSENECQMAAAALRADDLEVFSALLALCPQLTALKTKDFSDPSEEDARLTTLLHLAVELDSVPFARELLARGADVKALDGESVPPVIWVCSLPMLELLIEHGANPRVRNQTRQNLLHLAAATGLPDVIKFCLESLHINPNDTDMYSYTALHWAVQLESDEPLKILLETAVAPVPLIKPPQPKPQVKHTPPARLDSDRKPAQDPLPAAKAERKGAEPVALSLPLPDGPSESTRSKYRPPPIDLDAQDKDGNTALVWACNKGRTSKARLLLAAGASPYVLNTKLQAPVDHCTGDSPERIECLKVVLAEQITRAVGEANGTDLEIALRDVEDCMGTRDLSLLPFRFSLLHALIPEAPDQAMPLLRTLLTFKIPLNEPEHDGYPPLHQAGRMGKVEVVSALLSAGAEVDKGDFEAYSALLRVVRTKEEELPTPKKLECMNLLIKHGADLNYRDPEDGNTALIWAVFLGTYEVLAYLLRFPHPRIDTRIANHWGNRPFHYACYKAHMNANHRRCLDLLLEAAKGPHPEAAAIVPNNHNDTPLDLVSHSPSLEAIDVRRALGVRLPDRARELPCTVAVAQNQRRRKGQAPAFVDMTCANPSSSSSFSFSSLPSAPLSSAASSSSAPPPIPGGSSGPSNPPRPDADSSAGVSSPSGSDVAPMSVDGPSEPASSAVAPSAPSPPSSAAPSLAAPVPPIPSAASKRPAKRKKSGKQATKFSFSPDACGFCQRTPAQLASCSYSEMFNTVFRVPFHSVSQLVHRACAIWAPRVYAGTTDAVLHNVPDELARGRKVKCFLCKQPGAVTGCVVSACARTFHLPCVLACGGAAIDTDAFNVYCKAHAHKAPKSVSIVSASKAPPVPLPASSSRSSAAPGSPSRPDDDLATQRHKRLKPGQAASSSSTGDIESKAEPAAPKVIVHISDITNGAEPVPISVVNTVDGDELRTFHYTSEFIAGDLRHSETVAPQPLPGLSATTRRCFCVGVCRPELGCECAKAYTDGRFPFRLQRRSEAGEPLPPDWTPGAQVPAAAAGSKAREVTFVQVDEDAETLFECGAMCQCSPACSNRVTQRGLSVRLQAFKTPHKGWGIRTLENIHKGQFVVEYIGEIIGEYVANERSIDVDRHSVSYLFTPENSPFTFDPTNFGNIARFINHSCEPNLGKKRVYRDIDVESEKKAIFTRVAFFAYRDIPAGEELTIDYSYVTLQYPGRLLACRCYSHNCRETLL